jgi:iron complex transport system permease protein
MAPSTAAIEPAIHVVVPRGPRLGGGWLLAGFVALVGASIVGIWFGPVRVPPGGVILELIDRLPLIDIDSGLSTFEQTIVWEIRAPRVVLGILVGAMLCSSGATYQGVFRNGLADPYSLGVAAGAGLGATIAIVNRLGDGSGVTDPVPVFAFAGALLAVAVAATLGAPRGSSSANANLVLAGVAVAAFLTAIQTYVLQRNTEDLRKVYSWILGRLSTSSWGEVQLVLPYALVCCTGLWLLASRLDVLAVGEDEAAFLGASPRRIRITALALASFAAAAAVAVSGLIVFVGLIVPHAVRRLAGVTHRRVLPLSMLFGGAFLALTDVVARTIQAPRELPIGVVTACVGAPFFLHILRREAAV